MVKNNNTFKRVMAYMLVGIMVMLLVGSQTKDLIEVNATTANIPNISYDVHIQTYGWKTNFSNGDIAGTTDESKRLEAIVLNLDGCDATGKVIYRTHVQSIGWQNWVEEGSLAGTEGRSKRLEAIEIKLTDELADMYNISYRVHVQSYGWTGWVKNGQTAGTVGEAKRLEAIQIRLTTKTAINGTYLTYKVHAQSYGWMDEMRGGQVAGTTGEGKRLEALEFKLESNLSGDIMSSAHIQSYGWSNYIPSEMCVGTTGQSKRIEAIKLKLTGEIANRYDIYYRVHSQSYGWLGWAKNGDPAGTEGIFKRIEAIQVCLVEKGQLAPGSMDNAFYNIEKMPGSYSIKINKAQNCVTIYKGGVPIKAMVCSTGIATPIGTFSAKVKGRWSLMFGDVWAQYTTQITGNFLMHSVPYAERDSSTLINSYYNKLGTTCSAGCVRLSCGDAKWIYDNIPYGTEITIYSDENPGPLGKPKPIHLYNGETIDPTDYEALR